MPVLGVLKTEFFPADNQDIAYVNMTAEPGQKLEITSKQIATVEDMLRKEPTDIISSFTTTVGGIVSMRSSSPGGGGSTNVASVTINLKKKKEGREETSSDFANRLRTNLQTIQIPGVTFEIVELKGGPPAGADLEVRVTGDDFHTLNKIL
jgi:multidrug efflux pump subunit AcrB